MHVRVKNKNMWMEIDYNPLNKNPSIRTGDKEMTDEDRLAHNRLLTSKCSRKGGVRKPPFAVPRLH